MAPEQVTVSLARLSEAIEQALRELKFEFSPTWGDLEEAWTEYRKALAWADQNKSQKQAYKCDLSTVEYRACE